MSSALWAMIAHGTGWLRLDWQDGSRRESSFFPVEHAGRFERMVEHHAGADPAVSLAVAADRHPDPVLSGQVLWASVENTVSRRFLEAFRPCPTLIVGRGSRRVALWWLDRPLPRLADPAADWLTRANRRLAFALKANSVHADPSWMMPVWELLWADPSARYPARAVVGRLRDAPRRRFA